MAEAALFLGKIDEEHVEFIKEVQEESPERRDELVDIAVAAIWGVASSLGDCIMPD
jgi:ClpP class serine protease